MRWLCSSSFFEEIPESLWCNGEFARLAARALGLRDNEFIAGAPST